MGNYIKLILFGLVTLFALIAASYARDLAYMVNALEVALVAFVAFIWTLRHTDEPRVIADLSGEYMDGPVRAGVILTAFWGGVVGFLVGVTIAFQLAFPALNFEWAQGYINFGRMRPLHTSAVIFAFGGTGLITTSFYVVQRTSASRLWGWKSGLVRILGLSAFHPSRRDRLSSGGDPVEGIRRTRMVC